jgi:tetratricopeptide (TPR) repeat protein
LLCELYDATPSELGFGFQAAPDSSNGTGTDLLVKSRCTQDDLDYLSDSFDKALMRSSVEDINRLAHKWLITDAPQSLELASGRHIGLSLVETVEHRVVQLRRADDFLSGRDSHVLVRKELQETTKLLKEASYTDGEARRLLTAIGELAQLATWVAADAGLYAEATKYTEYGLLAAHAASNAPLAGNIISTFSYQLANTKDPQRAAVLARTAYAGARRDATATTRALLLERIAWADAKSGDLSGCEQALGKVEEAFDKSKPEDDPDWVYWLNREEIDVMAGRCYTELKRPRQAVALLDDAIAKYNHALVRENALYLSWLAEDYIQLGDIDHAVAVAKEVLTLASRTNSARTDERVQRLARLLKRYEDVQDVAEFLSLYREIAA